MLLQRLNEYADRLELPPTLYSEGIARYVMELDGAGRLMNPCPTDTADPSSPRTKRGERRLLPQVQRSSGVKPLLLADKADYTLGLCGEKGNVERASACQRAYLDLLERCADQTREPAVLAVLTFLRGDPLGKLELPADFDPSAIITFRVDGVFPTDLPTVQTFWAAVNDPDAVAGSPAPVMQCVVCGEQRPVLARLQGKVKGIPGGQTTGTSVISANADAFESYGLSASLISPTCASCGERFTKALNALLAGEQTRLVVGDVVFVFWTRGETSFNLRTFLADPKPEEVQALLRSVRTGHAAAAVDTTAFYAAALSASGGRTVVRDWIDTTVDEVQRHVATWFRRQAIVDPYGETHRPLGLFALAAATVREAKDIAPVVPRALLRAVLTGAPLPWDLLLQAVRRTHAEQSVSRQQAALIKLVLVSHQKEEQEDTMVQLDPNHPNPAYHCGRLLAVLEEAQRAAMPGVKASIVDRFYGTASSAPGAVFGRLLRGAQPHLAKLERDRPGAWRALQGRLEDVQSNLKEFPRILALADQGLFALGYYHQRAFDRAQAREASARKAAETATMSPADVINDNAYQPNLMQEED